MHETNSENNDDAKTNRFNFKIVFSTTNNYKFN